MDALKRGLCTDEERETCEFDYEENIEWACAKCPKARFEDLSHYTLALLQIRRMQSAGYPIEKNDLTRRQWLDLARINDTAQQHGKPK